MLWQLVLLFLLNLGTLGISTSNQVSQTTALRAAATLAQSASSADKAFRNVPPNWPIQRGYVAFGDSYGAGMGTGTTSTDGCRVGSNNFAALLMKWMGNPDIDFQLRVCSGDTLVGLNRQIGEWENPILADVATVSIGGNDLGFSDLVDSCLLHFKPWLEQKIYEEYCDSYKKTANKMLADQSTNGLKAKLKAAYKKILEKSERDDFHIYVTGYVAFFNQDTDDCDKSSFDYWWGGYDPWFPDAMIMLTKPIRAEMNDLVNKLNAVIQTAVEETNREEERHGVHYVDMNQAFNGHRWCEGSGHEPEPSNDNTYLFLSGWPDVDPATGAVSTNIQDNAELQALIRAPKVELPDAGTCAGELGTEPDPVAAFQCSMSIAVSKAPDGNASQALKAANEALAKGDFTDKHISYFLPTRQVKTFHPRSSGMGAYRDAIIAAIQVNQGQVKQQSSKLSSLAASKVATTLRTSTTTTAPPDKGPLCVPYAGADRSQICTCSSGSIYGKMPLLSGVRGASLCSYTTFTSEAPPASTATQAPYTFNDPWGDTIQCSPWTLDHSFNIGVPLTKCIGPTQVVKWAAPSETPSCKGQTREKHLDRNAAADIITKQFCPDATIAMTKQKNGTEGVTREYNKGKGNDVKVSITWEEGFEMALSNSECVDFLLTRLLDACDPKTDYWHSNPFNWKAGGTLRRGPILYSLTSLYVMEPPQNGGAHGRPPTK